MTDDKLPVAAAEPPISEDLRQREIDILHGLLTTGKVDLDGFQQALDDVLRVRTEADLAALVRSLPPPVAFTSPARRRDDPLEISTSIGEVRLDGRWQVGRLTSITADMGAVTLDLTDAEFDDWEVDLVVRTTMGAVTLIVPRGLDVRLVDRNGPVKSTLEPAIPGFPVVRLSVTAEMGTIRLMHPHEKPPHRRWRRRGRRARGT